MNRYFLPPPLPHLSASGTTDASRAVRWAYVRRVWSSGDVPMRVCYALACVAWPFVLACAAARETTRNGTRVAHRTGKSRLRQFLEQLWLGIVHTIRPRTYYIFELHDPARFAVAGSYLQRFETKGGVYSALKNRRVPASRRRCLADKLRFFERCRALKIATPRVLAAADNGHLLALEYDGGDLPPVDLFLKRRYGGGGKDAELWRYTHECWSRDGQFLDSEAFLQRALERSQRTPFIIQPALCTHVAVAGLSISAVSTARIITVVNEADEIEVCGAVFRMSIRPESATDNVHRDGIAAAIGIGTGRLGTATDIGLGPVSGWHDRHPVTGAQIRGTPLPHWQAAVELARRAHRLLNDRVIIGWDVAILEDGPVLVEGNGLPDLNVLQRAQGQPAGDSRLGHLLAWHLRRRASQRTRGQQPAAVATAVERGGRASRSATLQEQGGRPV